MMRRGFPLLNVGIVTRWIDAKGFGFIKDSESGKEYFTHFRSLQMTDPRQHRGLNVGNEVQFDADDSDTRSQAVNVTSIGGGPLPPFIIRDGVPLPKPIHNKMERERGAKGLPNNGRR